MSKTEPRPTMRVQINDKKERKSYIFEPYGQKRMTAQEREALLLLAGIKHYFVSNNFETLMERAKLYKNCVRDMKIIKTLVIKTFFELISTIPTEQVESLVRTCDMCTINAGARMVANSQRKANDGYGIMINYTELTELIRAANQTCLFCERDKCSENKCQLKITFDNLGCNADHSRGCEYRYKWDETFKG